MRAERLEDAGHAGRASRVEVGAALGDLAEPDRREVRARFGLDGNRLDEGADLVFRRRRRPRRPRATRSATASNMSRRISR